MGRTLAACVLPALVVSAAWLRVEDPRLVGEGLAVAALAVAAALPPRAWQRALAAVVATAGAAQVAFGVHAWELLPFRDRQVLAPVGDRVRLGVESFYEVLLPFEPGRHPEMHALVLAAIFGFVLVTSQLVAARKPVGAVAATIAGAGWPATLIGTDAVAIGAVALAAALSIPLVLRVRSVRSLAAGATLAGLVVVAAAWASSSTTAAREAALDWEAWSIRGDGPLPVTGVRFAWDSNYDGISFPPDPTVVLTIDGPERAHYWRTSTLGLFTDDHWFENLAWVSRIEGDVAEVPDGLLTPAAADNRDNWLAQEIEIRALVDDRLAAAGTPVALDSRQLGTVFLLTDGVLRMREPLSRGLRYRVWSYAPDPAPAVLVRSKPRYPDEAAGRFLRLESRSFMPFGAPGREAAARALFDDPSYSRIALYQPLYTIARRVAGRAGTPYEAVLALEGWFRQRGGFTYDEHPARVSGPPLVAFVTRTKEGYCQHYAGAMALMLRMLGIPARVAVGFTSGSRRDGTWVVTDHDAHAWVEAWFAGIGWVPFDPTPGRGTFGGNYSLASDSPEAVNALRRGQLTQRRVGDDFRDTAGLSTQVARDERAPSFAAAVLLLGALWVLVVGGGKAVVRRARLASRDPRRSAAASRRELEAFLRDQRIDVPPSATLDELRRTVGAELGLDGRAFATAVARARFGPPESAHRHAQAARRELRVLLRRMRLELSLWARFRGLLSLRSLQRGALR
jgi:transglutaminase superfamily protein/transglutaminase TgpA-like protein